MNKREELAYRLMENRAALGQGDDYAGHIAPWKRQPKGFRQRALADVDAILDALMEPGEAATAGHLAMLESGDVSYFDTPMAKHCWQAILQHIRDGGK